MHYDSENREKIFKSKSLYIFLLYFLNWIIFFFLIILVSPEEDFSEQLFPSLSTAFFVAFIALKIHQNSWIEQRKPEIIVRLIVGIYYFILRLAYLCSEAILEKANREYDLVKTGKISTNSSIKEIRPIWRNLNGDEFEKYISLLLLKIGYSNVYNRPHIGDGGIDIEATEFSKLTTSKIGIECKNTPNDIVGRPVVQKLDSALKHENFTKGIIITTGKFSNPAIEYAGSKNITLIDGEKLEKLISDYWMS